jgi:hypothetical protein
MISSKSSTLRSPAFRFFTAVLLAAWLAGLVSEAHAEDWMFRRSYFSHEPVFLNEPGLAAGPYAPPVQARWAYRKAYVGTGPGVAVRGGYRYNISNMRSGNNVDVTVLRENWFEFAP